MSFYIQISEEEMSEEIVVGDEAYEAALADGSLTDETRADLGQLALALALCVSVCVCVCACVRVALSLSCRVLPLSVAICLVLACAAAFCCFLLPSVSPRLLLCLSAQRLLRLASSGR